jgi:hypothetical protein
VSRVGIAWLRFVEPFAHIFRDQCAHRYRPEANSTVGPDWEILQVRDSLWSGAMVTTEVTERTPFPPACSGTRPAGQFSIRRSFILSTQAR